MRVAVVQLAYHAAFRSGGRGYLTEPLGEETLPLTQAHGDGDELRALRERVRTQYVAQLARLAIQAEGQTSQQASQRPLALTDRPVFGTCTEESRP